MPFLSCLPSCGCTSGPQERPLRISRSLFVSSLDGFRSVKKLHSREVGPTSARSVQEWRISPKFNEVTQIYGERKQWFLGFPRMIYPSLVRMRALLNSIPQDSLVSGALWVVFELDVPEYFQEDMKFILVSLLVFLLSTEHPTVDISAEAQEYLQFAFSTRSLERYISDTKTYLKLRQPVPASHIIVRSLAYRGLDSLMSPSAAMPPVKVILTVCNPRIGQFDQTYFSTLSPGGGILPLNQSVNATDEIVFSVYLRNVLVCRFQTAGFALIDAEKGPLKLYKEDLSDLELYKPLDDPDFFLEIFAECLQWMSETGGTSLAHGTQNTDNNTMDDSEAILNVAQRLQPQSGVQLSMEEKCAIVLSALPTYPHKPLARLEGESDDDFTLRTQCQICLCDYEDGDQVRALPCMHAFHAACTESWLRIRLQCPNCLADMVQLLSSPPPSPSAT